MKRLSQNASIKCLFFFVVALAILFSHSFKAQEGADKALKYLPNDPQVCLMCHGVNSAHPAESVMHGIHGNASSKKSPLAADQKGCQSCHGPSASHLQMSDGIRPPPPITFDPSRPSEKGDAACLSCHENTVGHHWAGSAHEFSQQGCTSCHSIHKEQDSILNFKLVNNQCMDCHQRQRSEIMRPSSHPLRSGQLNCIDCHSPHGGPGPAQLKAFTLNDQCLDCHAEKRGPFLWEHAPVTEDCSSCHTAHGSNHGSLLKARSPFLCQQCHQAAYHPSNQESGMGIPPRGASSNLLGKDCLNCHTQVHGSNHPSGAGLTR